MEDEKLTGRVIIETVLLNMRQQVEELRYSKIVPAAYDVYLHADDVRRFEHLTPEIAAEAVRALQETLDGLNRPSRLDGVRGVIGKPRLPFKKVGPWLIRITLDPEGTVPRGRALVVSQIALAGTESFEGQRTRRLATLSEPAAESRPSASRPAVSLAPVSRARLDPVAPATLAEGGSARGAETEETAWTRVLGVLAWQDEAGSHDYRMTARELTVGRAGQGSTADVRLATVHDVSRVHFRLRHHSEDGRFTIEDVSLLGTTVNGRPLERGVPQDLPVPADIRLADAITLRFEAGAPA